MQRNAMFQNYFAGLMKYDQEIGSFFGCIFQVCVRDSTFTNGFLNDYITVLLYDSMIDSRKEDLHEMHAVAFWNFWSQYD